MQNLKIISWNVNGIRSIMKKDFLRDIDAMNPDVICLQETKASEISGSIKSRSSGFIETVCPYLL